MNFTRPPIDVAIYQPVIPAYRVPFFNALKRNTKFNLEVFASMSGPGLPDTSKHTFEFAFHPVEYKDFLGNRLVWQTGIRIPDHFVRGDVIVICGNPRYLHNYYLIFCAKLKRLGVVWWGHGHTLGRKRWSESLRRQIMKLADVILLYTDKELEEYKKIGFESKRLFATNNTIDIAEIEGAKKSWSEAQNIEFKNKHSIQEFRNILFCGRLTPKTELPIAFEAMSILLKKDPSYRLIIIGDGPDKDNLICRAKEMNVNDFIFWCGPIYDQKKLAPWFLNSLVFLYPGGIGLSLLHAFAYGLPVITHNEATYHPPEFAALRNNYNGLLFKKGRALDLAYKIDELVNDPSKCKQMGVNALTTIKNDYSLDNMVNRFIQAVASASYLVNIGADEI